MNRIIRIAVRIVTPLAVALAVFLSLSLAASVVYAAPETPAAEPNALSRLADIAFQVLVPVLSLFAAYLTNRLIGVFEQKTGFDVADKHEQWIRDWVEKGIHLGEEWSYKKVKGQTGKLTGPEKLEVAADFVLDMVAKYNIPGWTRDKVTKYIEAQLGTHRANGGKPTLDSNTNIGPTPLPPAA